MDEETLILIVQKYTAIYDMSDSRYCNQQIKDNCWQDISKAMKIPAEDCKEAWRKLRDGYRKAINARKSKSGQAAQKKRPWKFVKQMSFLAPHLVERSTHSNSDESQSTSTDSIPYNLDDNTQQIISDRDTEDEDINTIHDEHIKSPGQRAEIEQKKNSRKRPSKNTNNESTDVSNFIVGYLKNKSKKAEVNVVGESSQLSRFFLNMAETVEDFPKKYQIEIKSQVFELITKYEKKVHSESEIARMELDASTSLPVFSSL